MAQARGTGGALVTEIDAGSPAERAGLKIADVILGVDGIQTDSGAEFITLVRTFPPGETLQLQVLRGVDELTVAMKTAALPADYLENYGERLFGWEVVDGRRGVTVSKVVANSPAYRIEVLPGDLIAEVEGVRVGNVAEYHAQLEQHLGRLPLHFTVVRGNRGYRVELP
jgi:serine protease Do